MKWIEDGPMRVESQSQKSTQLCRVSWLWHAAGRAKCAGRTIARRLDDQREGCRGLHRSGTHLYSLPRSGQLSLSPADRKCLKLRRRAIMERGIVSGMLSNAHAELGCRVGCVAWW